MRKTIKWTATWIYEISQMSTGRYSERRGTDLFLTTRYSEPSRDMFSIERDSDYWFLYLVIYQQLDCMTLYDDVKTHPRSEWIKSRDFGGSRQSRLCQIAFGPYSIRKSKDV